MLRKRSASKQSVMAESGSVLSPTNKYTKPNMSFFNSPLLFTGLSTKGCSETDASRSPTSTLDSMFFPGLANPFWTDKTSPTSTKSPQEASLENKHSWMKRGVGLGIVDDLNDDGSSDLQFPKPDSRMVLFGSQLKIQIPPLSTFPNSTDRPQSSADFGIKTRNSQLELLSASPNPSPSSARKSPFGSVASGVDGSSPRIFSGYISASEMESSEDYTCVITHGPNPKMTHIFEDCIVDDCCGVVGFSSLKKDNWFLSDQPSYPSDDFLSFCFTCKKSLGQGKDIYMYRGEKAFCSSECRHQEIMFEEGMEKTDLGDPDKS